MKKADPDSLPRTDPKILAVLIVILIGLMIATFKAALYPSPPSSWSRLHEPQAISVADANKLLSDSGAYIDSIKPAADLTTETWNFKHRTGHWTILVCFKKTPKGDVIQSVHIRCEISHFPSLTRTWDYPPGTPAPAPTKQPPAPPSTPPTTTA
ncbi:hypothetical protein [Prosthecobacter sp.]|uniref:hypothetical protein n=1 Tax=Prosthecobacter sp. TaxID=1965333 RepID=UPI003784ED25